MKAYELYQKISPELALQQFQWMRDDERELYKTAISTLASAKKLRPVFVTKKSVPEQVAWIVKQLINKKNNPIAEHLLQAFFMKGQQDMLVTFCDGLEIKHDGKGTVEEELPENLDKDKLKIAVDALFDKFEPEITSLYLYVFNIQTTNGWDSLTEILDKDSRVLLK